MAEKGDIAVRTSVKRGDVCKLLQTCLCPVMQWCSRILRALLGATLVVFCLVHPLAAAERLATYDSLQHSFRLTKVAGGLEHPWSLAFLPDGSMLVTERPGRLRRIINDLLIAKPLAGLPPVYARGQGGLLDVALHPRFEENRLVYLSYASQGEGGAATAVARGRLVGDRLEDVEEIYVALPRAAGSRHFGSRLLFAEGYLFITAGERGDMDRAQALDDPAGTILRLHDDGGTPCIHVPASQLRAMPVRFQR